MRVPVVSPTTLVTNPVTIPFKPKGLTRRDRTIFVHTWGNPAIGTPIEIRDRIDKQAGRKIIAEVIVTRRKNLVLITLPTIRASTVLSLVQAHLKKYKPTGIQKPFTAEL